MKIICGINFQRNINLTDIGHVQILIFLVNLVSRYFLIRKQAFQVHEWQNLCCAITSQCAVTQRNKYEMYLY